MSALNSKAAMVAAGLLAGGALLYFAWSRFRVAADRVLDPITRPLTDAFVRLTSPPVAVADGAVLPSGERVTFDALHAAGASVNSRFEFAWRGRRYRLTSRRSDGWYDAVVLHA